MMSASAWVLVTWYGTAGHRRARQVFVVSFSPWYRHVDDEVGGEED